MFDQELAINTLSEVGGQDDKMWPWLIDEVSNILGGKKLEAELKFGEDGPFQSCMTVHMADGRVYVNMESFGYGIVYSWKVEVEDDEHYFDDFKLEHSSLEGGNLS